MAHRDDLLDRATLRRAYAAAGPVVTALIATPSATEDAAKQLEIRRGNLERDLRERDVDDATREAVLGAVGDHALGGTRLVAAAGGEVLLALSLPEPPGAELLAVGPLPRLLPLFAAADAALPHVVVLADRTGADILGYTSGPDPVSAVEVSGGDWPLTKVHAGGWREQHMHAAVEKTWEDNAEDVAHQVALVADKIGAAVVVGTGDERALGYVADHLPAELADRWRTVSGGRAADGSAHHVAGRVLEVLAERRAAQTLELLDRFALHRGEGRAADGPVDTLAALRKAQVGTLVVTDGLDDARTAWYGEEPTAVAADAAALADLGVTEPREAPLVDVLLRAAVGTDADVTVVTGAVEESPRDGVGALLRYADPGTP